MIKRSNAISAYDSEEYKAKGYETSIEKATKGKDFNEMLVYLKNR